MHEKVLTSLDDIICLTDDMGNIIYSNKSQLEISTLAPVSNNMYTANKKAFFKTEKDIDIDGKMYKLYQYKESTELYNIINNQKIDPTTGLPNRQVVDDYLKMIMLENNSCIIAMIDIDNFKTINDTFGHLFGDEVISELSSLLKIGIRNTDFIGRYGGEEFIVILNSNKIADSIHRFESLRQSVENHFNNDIYKITISTGVTAINKGDSITNKIEEADEALYYVKEHGKNNVGYWNENTGKIQVTNQNYNISK